MGLAVRLSSERSVLAEVLRPTKEPRLSNACGRCDRGNGEGKRKGSGMCERIPETAFFPRLMSPGGRSRARHCGIRDSDGRRDKLARPRLATAGARRMRPPNSAVPSGLGHGPRAAPPDLGEPTRAHRPVVVRLTRDDRPPGAFAPSRWGDPLVVNGRKRRRPQSRRTGPPAHVRCPPAAATGSVRTPAFSRVLWVVPTRDRRSWGKWRRVW